MWTCDQDTEERWCTVRTSFATKSDLFLTVFYQNRAYILNYQYFAIFNARLSAVADMLINIWLSHFKRKQHSRITSIPRNRITTNTVPARTVESCFVCVNLVNVQGRQPTYVSVPGCSNPDGDIPTQWVPGMIHGETHKHRSGRYSLASNRKDFVLNSNHFF